MLTSEVPLAALKSAVTVTFPVAAPLGVKSIYVPSVVSKVVTPVLEEATFVHVEPAAPATPLYIA